MAPLNFIFALFLLELKVIYLLTYIVIIFILFQPTGFLETKILYSSIEDIYSVIRWDANYKYCLRIVLPDGSLLLQVSTFIIELNFDKIVDQYTNFLLHFRLKHRTRVIIGSIRLFGG